MINIEADNIKFDRKGMRARLIIQLYTRGLNHVPQIFLCEDREYGNIVSEEEIIITKDRFEEVHFGIRKGIKQDLYFKKQLRENTYKVLSEFRNAVQDMEQSIFDGTINENKMYYYLSKHEEVLALTEFNGCLPLNWYEELIKKISDGKYQYSEFGYTHMMSHRQFYRNGKLSLAKEYIENGKINAAALDKFWTKYYYLSPHLDHFMYIKDNEEEKFMEEIQKTAAKYSVEDIQREIRYSKNAYHEGLIRYNNKLTDIKCMMQKKKYSDAEIENNIEAIKIISLATTEEEYRHIVQDKFFRLMAYIFKVYDLCPTYSSQEMLLATIKAVPFKFVKNNYPSNRIARNLRKSI